MSEPARVVLLGDLGDRRAESFLGAARAAGLEVLGAVDHRALLEDPASLLALPDRPAWLRLDALGGSGATTRALVQLSGNPGTPLERASPRYGELVAPAARHRGMVQYFHQLDAVVLRRPCWRWLTPPARIVTCFDKDATAAHLATRGVPTTRAVRLGEPTTDALRAAMAEAPTVYVKLRWGSSASGLAVVSHRRGRTVVWTTMERDRGRWFNSLRIRRLDRDPDQRLCLDWLLGEGARVEVAERKARLRGRHCDLRVVVVEGQARLALPRTSAHPITNLHLGGQRAEARELRSLVGETRWARAMAYAEHAADGAFMVGVDLLFRAEDHAPRVIEVNAFGDLLPGLRSEGRTAYDWQVAAIAARGAPSTGSRRAAGSERSSRPAPKTERSPSRSRCT